MKFATLVLFCISATTASQLRCKCDSAGEYDDSAWTSQECKALHRNLRYCYSEASNYCDVGPIEKARQDFTTACGAKGPGCYADEC